MCGIFAIFNHTSYNGERSFKSFVDRESKKQSHRGPEWRCVRQVAECSALAHERLCIVGNADGEQPLSSNESSALAVVNGEIFNYKQLINTLKNPHKMTSKSDCEVILHLYEEEDIGFIDKLDGMFAFVIYHEGRYIIGRDHFGLNPLYQGWHSDGSVWVSSEMKCLSGYCERIIRFPPGYIYDSLTGDYTRYYNPSWMNYSPIFIKPCYDQLKLLIHSAITQQTDLEVPFGIFLSGGFASTLLVSILRKVCPDKELHTFTIGSENASIFDRAKRVAEKYNCIHHQVVVSLDEAVDILEDIIYHVESFNVRLIRNAIPIYLLSKRVKLHGIKVILTGDGLNEVMYNTNENMTTAAPLDVHRHAVKLITSFYAAGGLRGSKAIMAFGIEARMPFLSKDLVNYLMTVSPKYRYKSRKHGDTGHDIIRDCFSISGDYIDEDTANLKQISIMDGFGGKDFKEYLGKYINKKISDERFNNADRIFPFATPSSKEEFYYRSLFERNFNNQSATLTAAEIPKGHCGITYKRI